MAKVCGSRRISINNTDTIGAIVLNATSLVDISLNKNINAATFEYFTRDIDNTISVQYIATS